jgi:hypothetical protein
MAEQEEVQQLLRMLVQLTARHAFPEDLVRKMVAPTARSRKQLAVYNLCDGTRTQGAIRAVSRVAKASLSQAISRWEQSGIMCRLGKGRDARPLHVYPLSSRTLSPKSRKEG